ncbi:hypothetical protein AMTRI_Chr01g105230 [Amborella trichopoda]
MPSFLLNDWRRCCFMDTLISGQVGVQTQPYRGVSWNDTVTACVQSDMFQEAFELFERAHEKLNLDKFVAAR